MTLAGLPVAVTGAAGFIGSNLVRHLEAAGAEVRAVVRHRSGATPRPPGSQVVADVTDARSLREALAGTSAVFHLAARLHEGRPAPEELRRVNVGGTSAVVAEMPRGARLVMFSSVSVYGAGAGAAPFTEESPLAPRTAYAASKLEAEGAAQRHSDVVVLRSAATYGPGMRGNYVRLVDAVARRRFVFVGDGSNRRTLIHVDDACRAALAALEAPSGGIYNATDGMVWTLEQIVAAIAAAAGVPQPRLHLPAWPLRAGAAMAAAGARLAGRTPVVSPETVTKFTEDLAVAGDRLQQETRFRPRMRIAEGWRTVTAWLAAG